MLVVAVGAHSQKGKIKALLQKEQEVPTPPPNSHQSRRCLFCGLPPFQRNGKC